MKLSDILQIIHDIDVFGIYEDYSTKDLIEVLKYLDAEYYNDDAESPWTDELYDCVKEFVWIGAPNDPYFKTVGSEERGGKIDLPYTMGSLNQVYIGEIEEWVEKNKLENEMIVIVDKLDGASELLSYSKELQIGYSRGDGIQGADNTRHLRKMSTVPNKVDSVSRMHVRGEAIISHTNFPKLLEVTANRKKPYKNARNAASGIMNASDNPDAVYDLIDFIAYDIADNEAMGKVNTLMLLEAANFKLPWYEVVFGSRLTDEYLANLLEERRKESPYQLDGLVLDVNCPIKREQMNKGNKDLNPMYSIKYKVADAENIAEATCVFVEWNASKHAYWKPRIRIEPIQLCGVTVSWTQGFNAKFINDNNIGPGTRFMITRTGDVIPHIVGGTKKPQITFATEAQMPEEDWIWNDTGVDAILVDKYSSDDVLVNQLIDFFTKLKVPGLKEGNITTLVQSGYDTPEDIIKMDLPTMQRILNSEIIGEKVFDGIHSSLINVPFERLMGANSTSRGIGIRRVNSVYKEFGLNIFEITHAAQLLNIEGIQEKTAEKVMDEIIMFKYFLEKINGYYNFADAPIPTDKNTGQFANQYIVMTGFRDSALEQRIETNGGEVQSGVNKKTTLVIAADPNENSGKIKKAKDLGVLIVSLVEFRAEY